jgi:hypothetical protein
VHSVTTVIETETRGKMSKRTIVALTGPWAIVMHIGLTRVRGWSQTIFLDHHWFFATVFCFFAMVVVSGISLALFSGKPKSWPWGKTLSILGTSVVSAVLLTASVALESLAQSSNADAGAVGLFSFEAAFLSFFVVLMKAILVGDGPLSREENNTLTWWQKLKLGFREGQHQVQ